jgi:hypothetical protein
MDPVRDDKCYNFYSCLRFLRLGRKPIRHQASMKNVAHEGGAFRFTGKFGAAQNSMLGRNMVMAGT